MSTRTPSQDCIHSMFGLTYASYLVLPRTLLQSMPDEWQRDFVALLSQYHAATGDVEQPEVYEVTAGEEIEYGDLTKEQRKALGVSKQKVAEGGPPVYYDKFGTEHEHWHRTVLPRPDPLADYQRGRRTVALDLEAYQEARRNGNDAE